MSSPLAAPTAGLTRACLLFWGACALLTPRLPSPHGLRHSFASVADDLGLSEPTIAALLGHAGGGVTRGYIHKLDAALLAAADKVAGRVANLMAGVADAGAEVVELASAWRASA
jgi:integrase